MKDMGCRIRTMRRRVAACWLKPREFGSPKLNPVPASRGSKLGVITEICYVSKMILPLSTHDKVL